MSNSNTIKSLGELKKHESISIWLVSDGIEIPFFENKKLRFIIEFDNSDETFFQKAEVAVKNFLALDSEYRKSVTKLVYKNYRAVVDDCGMDEIAMNNEFDIWSHVSPQEIFLKTKSYFENGVYLGKDIFITVLCECDWEEEHGLSLDFRMGESLKDVEN